MINFWKNKSFDLSSWKHTAAVTKKAKGNASTTLNALSWKSCHFMAEEPEGNLGNGFSLVKGKEFSGPLVAATKRDFRSQRLILPWLWKRDLQVLNRRVWFTKRFQFPGYQQRNWMKVAKWYKEPSANAMGKFQGLLCLCCKHSTLEIYTK